MPSHTEGAGAHLRPGNGLDRDQLSDAQRARMLVAIAEAGCARGAPHVTVADVVARSGVSRRTFYEHFADRDECFLAAFDAALERLAACVRPAYERPGVWRERIRAGLEEALAFLDDEPFLGDLLVVQVLGAGPKALARRQRVLAHAIVAVDEGLEQSPQGHEPPPLTAEGVVGAVFSVVHARFVDERHAPLIGLTAQLMSMIVLPYLGAAAARRELDRPAPQRAPQRAVGIASLRGLDMRLTYRTIRVLTAVGDRPGASNREVAVASGVADQGQISKLLRRLQELGLVHNQVGATVKGERNAWALTERGAAVREAISGPRI
jgi:AcrR family transcriptional regulator